MDIIDNNDDFLENEFLEEKDLEETYDTSENTKLPNTLKMYMLEVEKHPLLTLEEEVQLGKLLKSVRTCKLLKKDSRIKNELDYNLVINHLYSYIHNEEIKLLMDSILNFISKKPNPAIKIISNLVENKCESSKSPCTEKTLDIDQFKLELNTYLNYLKAREKMINSNLRLVIAFVKKYANYRINLIDLINDGNIGLIMATENFDIDKGYRFSTYAIWWIRQSVIRHLYANTVDIATPESKLKEVITFRKNVKELEERTGKKFTNQELAEILGIEYKKIVEYMGINPTISLETPLTHDGNDATLKDIVANESDSVEKSVFKSTLGTEILCLLENLTEQEKNVIFLRFGLGTEDGRTYTLEEIGKMQHVTKERIRAVEAKAIKKMRISAYQNPKVKELKIYLTD